MSLCRGILQEVWLWDQTNTHVLRAHTRRARSLEVENKGTLSVFSGTSPLLWLCSLCYYFGRPTSAYWFMSSQCLHSFHKQTHTGLDGCKFRPTHKKVHAWSNTCLCILCQCTLTYFCAPLQETTPLSRRSRTQAVSFLSPSWVTSYSSSSASSLLLSHPGICSVPNTLPPLPSGPRQMSFSHRRISSFLHVSVPLPLLGHRWGWEVDRHMWECLWLNQGEGSWLVNELVMRIDIASSLGFLGHWSLCASSKLPLSSSDGCAPRAHTMLVFLSRPCLSNLLLPLPSKRTQPCLWFYFIHVSPHLHSNPFSSHCPPSSLLILRCSNGLLIARADLLDPACQCCASEESCWRSSKKYEALSMEKKIHRIFWTAAAYDLDSPFSEKYAIWSLLYTISMLDWLWFYSQCLTKV